MRMFIKKYKTVKKNYMRLNVSKKLHMIKKSCSQNVAYIKLQIKFRTSN